MQLISINQIAARWPARAVAQFLVIHGGQTGETAMATKASIIFVFIGVVLWTCVHCIRFVKFRFTNQNHRLSFRRRYRRYESFY